MAQHEFEELHVAVEENHMHADSLAIPLFNDRFCHRDPGKKNGKKKLNSAWQ